MLGHISNFSDLLASCVASVQDKRSAEEGEIKATSTGIEHSRDAKGGQFWTGYV